MSSRPDKRLNEWYILDHFRIFESKLLGLERFLKIKPTVKMTDLP